MGGVNGRSRDDMKIIHAENSLDLGEASRQEPKVSSGHTLPSQHFELLRTFRSALACKDITTNNSETVRQIILKATS
jgi:hypothetical protein